MYTTIPVHHGYVQAWQDWPWSSAAEFLKRAGRAQAMEIWKRYPILDYGKKWDIGEPPGEAHQAHTQVRTI
jgi:hypothetical protein